MTDEEILKAMRQLQSQVLDISMHVLAMKGVVSVLASKNGIDPQQVLSTIETEAARQKEKYLLGIGDVDPRSSDLLGTTLSLEEIERRIRSLGSDQKP